MPDIDYGQILEALNDKVDLSGSWSAPSSQYIDLTLGASGTTYTAPADGYYQCGINYNANGAYFVMSNNTARLASFSRHYCNDNWETRLFMPCKKGDVVQIGYSNKTSTNHFRFIYAQKTN